MFAEHFADTKVLDLFCAGNPIKRYVKAHKINCQVTGVDLNFPQADIMADIAKIEQYIKPEGQFDIVTSFGSMFGVEDINVTQKYLKPKGLYITKGSDQYFEEEVIPVINNPKKPLSSVYQKETLEVLKYFKPIVAIGVYGIASDAIGKFNEVYLIWRKRLP